MCSQTKNGKTYTQRRCKLCTSERQQGYYRSNEKFRNRVKKRNDIARSILHAKRLYEIIAKLENSHG